MADTAPASDVGLHVQEIVYAGLDLLRATMPLDLCAYVHASADFGPQLFLRAPDLSSMKPTEAFTLFARLRDVLEGRQEADALHIGDYVASAIVTQGPRSRGLHVIGRRGEALAEEERAVVARACRAVGTVCHALEDSGDRGDSTGVDRVTVEAAEGRTRAEAAIRIAGDARTGTGEAGEPLRAVALAVVAACDDSLKLAEAGDGEVGGERVVLVLLANDRGESAVGAALSGQDPLRATAAATLEAATRLRPPAST